MTTHIQLNPTIPLDTPKGKATAHFLIDYGEEHYLHFACFIDETGDQWTFRNDEVRMQGNLTMRPKKPLWRPDDNPRREDRPNAQGAAPH